MLLVTRLTLLVTSAFFFSFFLLLSAEDTTTLIYDDFPTAKITRRQSIDLSELSPEQHHFQHRQARVFLHAEFQSSKAKREQTLRNILSARRRQLLTQRSAEPLKPHSSQPRTSTPKTAVDEDENSDILEAQESRQGIYVTIPEETDASTLDEFTSTTTMTNLGNSKDERNVSKSSSEDERNPLQSRTDSSQSRNSTNSNSKSLESDGRRKNIVAMPESLYNHFRPVESNIPIEDMSQFLYFGQKLHPETQNATGTNNSLDTTTPTMTSSSRRRSNSKRLGNSSSGSTQTPKLEEIVNEEMNIAIERPTVEKNKIAKLKNNFRASTGGSIYYRKPGSGSNLKPSESTIVPNVLENRNLSNEINSYPATAFPPNSSAHASSGAPDLEMGSAVDTTTQIPDTSTSFEESKKMESEIVRRDDVDRDNGPKNHTEIELIDNADPGRPIKPPTLPQVDFREGQNSNATNNNNNNNNSEKAMEESRNPTSTTLRIIVTEKASGEDTTSRNESSTTPITGINSSVVPPVTPGAQQHVYAYTITNVTRLLRNYTGPGLSKGEHIPSTTSRSTGTSEIRTEPLLLHRTVAAGGSIEKEVHSLTELSVDTDVGGATTESSPEQEREGLVKRPSSRAAGNLLRWNHTSAKFKGDGDGDGDGANVDRRFFRKSASAVLNQRTDGVTSHDERNKRRRLSSQNRRTKGSNEPNSRVVGFNRTTRPSTGNMTMSHDDESESKTQVPIPSTDAFPVVPQEKRDDADSTRGNSNSTMATVTETIAESTTLDSELETETSMTMPKETNVQMTTPAFPVTPKIVEENSTRVEVDDKVNPEDRPFGLAKDLDPSEIQKMYRAKNGSAKTEGEETRKGGYQRSPEVRGRNLSDKHRDKDDILPIMHLYNTSDIFSNGNGNGNVSRTKDSFSHDGQPGPRLALPVEKKREGFTTMTADTVVDESTTSSTMGTKNVNVLSSFNGDRRQTPNLPSENRQENKSTEIGSKRNEVVAETFVVANNHQNGSGNNPKPVNGNSANRTRHKSFYYHNQYHHHTIMPIEFNHSIYNDKFNQSFFDSGGGLAVNSTESGNISEVISKRHDGDTIVTQATIAVVSYILATLVVFPIAVGFGLILRRLIIRNRKVLEESDTSSEISCRKDALNLENGDFKTSIEKAITKLPRIQHLCHEAEKPPLPPTPKSRWEFPRDKLRLQTVLGQGNFGQVWKAEADDLTGHQGTTRLVAVKTVKEGASDREKEDLVRELEIMQQLGSHPNVVTLLGCCTEEEPLYLILEYVMYGKLLAYLRDHRTRQDFYNFSEDSAALTSRDLTVFGYCVARGMEYLASKKIIHRDLAARNVLVDHNKLCKIADFGMSRFANSDGEVIETRQGRNALPIRWMAPESLIYSLFTTKTDVWGFGILMWEIVTLGSTPYPDMTARDVMRNVQKGYRLERPSHCRSELFKVIARCWHADPDRRPEFQTLRRDLAQLLEDNMNGHYVDLESFASECTD